MTETGVSSQTREVVDRYFAVWNEADGNRRRELIAGIWASDGSYVDPLSEADGPDALDALVGGFHQRFPGHRFRLIGSVDAHHDRARWSWELFGPDGGAPMLVGVDFAVFAADGRLREVTGFFEPPTGAA
jgi:hypothetical protein